MNITISIFLYKYELFKDLQKIIVDLNSKKIDNVNMNVLSVEITVKEIILIKVRCGRGFNGKFD